MSGEKPVEPMRNPGGRGSSGPLPAWVARVEAIRGSAGTRRVFYGVLAALVMLDIFIPKEHAVVAWEAWTGFSALYGFIACVAIILFSKWIGHAVLMVREAYYND